MAKSTWTMLKVFIVLAIIVILFLPVSNVFSFSFNTSSWGSVQKNLGQRSPYMLSSVGFSTPFGNMSFNNYINMKKLEDKEFSQTTESGKLQEIVTWLRDFTYNANQGDPNKLDSLGGNCQAVSLMVKHHLDNAKIQNGLVLDYENNHMYNWVIVDGEKLSVDLINNVITEYEEKEEEV